MSSHFVVPPVPKYAKAVNYVAAQLRLLRKEARTNKNKTEEPKTMQNEKKRLEGLIENVARQTARNVVDEMTGMTVEREQKQRRQMSDLEMKTADGLKVMSDRVDKCLHDLGKHLTDLKKEILKDFDESQNFLEKKLVKLELDFETHLNGNSGGARIGSRGAQHEFALELEEWRFQEQGPYSRPEAEYMGLMADLEAAGFAPKGRRKGKGAKARDCTKRERVDLPVL